jgi:hypothetical protein
MADKSTGIESSDLPQRPATTDGVAAWRLYAEALESRILNGDTTDPRELAAKMTAR